MNTPENQDWRSIFSVLLKEQLPEVGGRTEIPEELRDDMELLARGELDEAKIQKLCEKIVLTPEALTTLALLIRDSRESSATDTNS